MKIQESYDLDIFIDGLNIFEAPGVIFLGARIYESIENPLPYCTLTLSVPINWMNQRTIVDGTKIRFDIKSKKFDIAESLYFRLYNITDIAIEQKFCKVALNGMLDFYQGYQSLDQFNIYGSSAEIFRNIANTYELVSNIDDTNDSQLWIAGECNLYQHLGNIARHGWADETSCMFWAFDRHKILLYKNLTTLFRNRGTPWAFVQLPNYYDAEKKIYGYAGATLNIQSGKENLIYEGYGGTDKYFDLTSYTWKDITATKVVAESNLINISKELSKGLASNWYPFDVGNFHKNYWLARKQNARIFATYSTYIALECQYLMNYRLGQIVKFNFMDSQDLNNKINVASGIFIIKSIDTHLTSKSITSSLTLAMQGLNGQATTRETY